MNRIANAIRTTFITGLLAVVPVIVTLLALRTLFVWLDGILGPWVANVVGRQLPGLGVAATIVIVFVMGLVAKNFLGRRFIALGEGVFGRVPLVRRIYRTSKEIVDALTLPRKHLFKEVVMVESPRKGLYSYGFVMSYTMRAHEAGAMEVANVFVPNLPIPTTGIMIAIPTDDIDYLDMSVDEALKLVLSGGVVCPGEVRVVPRPLPAPDTPGDA